MPVPLPGEVRELFERPNYVHLSTLRADGTPRNWVVWAGVEGDRILICTGAETWKARDMRGCSIFCVSGGPDGPVWLVLHR
jgi:hypothetical protein